MGVRLPVSLAAFGRLAALWKVAMFREIRVHEVVEMLRRWQAGQGLRTIEAAVGVDRKMVRRYVDATVDAGLTRDGSAVDEAVVAEVVERVRPHRPDGHGHAEPPPLTGHLEPSAAGRGCGRWQLAVRTRSTPTSSSVMR